MKTYEVLEKALALIEDERNWAPEGDLLPDGRMCARGALGVALFGVEPHLCFEGHRVVFDLPAATGALHPAHQALRRALPADVSLTHFNDTYGHAAVVALFQRAIAAEKRKAGVYLDVPANDVPTEAVAA